MTVAVIPPPTSCLNSACWLNPAFSAWYDLFVDSSLVIGSQTLTRRGESHQLLCYAKQRLFSWFVLLLPAYPPPMQPLHAAWSAGMRHLFQPAAGFKYWIWTQFGDGFHWRKKLTRCLNTTELVLSGFALSVPCCKTGTMTTFIPTQML